MGLPVYSESASNGRPQSTVKSDPTAGARSAIRRQPTARSRISARFAYSPSVQQGAAQLLQTMENEHSRSFGSFMQPDTPGERLDNDRQLPRDVMSNANPRDIYNNAGSGSLEDDLAREAQARDDVERELLGLPRDGRERIYRGLYVSGERSPRPHSRRGPPSNDFFPPLRRMSRRNIADEMRPRDRQRRRAARMPPAPEVNGLGDRQRSWSTDSDHDHDQWETFLNTITPDPSLPSASSSFASGAATAANNGAADPASLPSGDHHQNNRPRRMPDPTNRNASQSRSISPIPPPYMATPETDSNLQNEAEDNDNCDMPPMLSLVSPSATSDSDSATDLTSSSSSSSGSEDDHDHDHDATPRPRRADRRAQLTLEAPSAPALRDGRMSLRMEQAEVINEFREVCGDFASLLQNVGAEHIDPATHALIATLMRRIRHMQPQMAGLMYGSSRPPQGRL